MILMCDRWLKLQIKTIKYKYVPKFAISRNLQMMNIH